MSQRTGNVLNPARRMVVRLGLATGATISAILGAQTLALLDQHPAATTAPDSATTNTSVSGQQTATNSATAVQPTVVAKVIDDNRPNAAPLIIIIRNPGVTSATADASGNKPVLSQIVPPAAKLMPPAPVVVQAPAAITTGGGGGGNSGGGGGGGGRPASQPAPGTSPSRR